MVKTLVPDNTLLHAIGKRVQLARKEKGIPRRVLSEISGVSPRYLAQLESGTGNASVTLLSRVAAALDRPIEWFLTSDTEPLTESAQIAQLYQSADVQTRMAVRQALQSDTRANRVCLIGLRGAGKSTLGGIVADRLGVPFVELNDEIETLAGMPVSEIIALYGPEGYRKLESDALRGIHARHKKLILAAAGGIVAEPDTYARLLSGFHTIWLHASPAEHMERVRAQGDERPMAGNPAAMEQLRSLLSDRESQYARANAQLDTSNMPADKAVTQLLALIEKRRFLR